MSPTSLLVPLRAHDGLSPVLLTSWGLIKADIQAVYEYHNNSISLESEIAPPTKSTQSGAIIPADDPAPTEYLSLQEVAKHNLSQDSWVIINGKVYE